MKKEKDEMMKVGSRLDEINETLSFIIISITCIFLVLTVGDNLSNLLFRTSDATYKTSVSGLRDTASDGSGGDYIVFFELDDGITHYVQVSKFLFNSLKIGDPIIVDRKESTYILKEKINRNEEKTVSTDSP